ncbi:MAG: helix-turn-helix domain-containing protein [Pseudomarimonas sp.]
MDYLELTPPPALQRHLQCLWRLRVDQPAATAQTIYPDGRCELIVHLGPPMRRLSLQADWHTQAECLFAAQMRSAVRLAAAGRVDCVGVRLQPAASGLLLGAALAGLVDAIVDLRQHALAIASDFSAACKRYADNDNPAPLWAVLEAQCAGFMIDAQIDTVVAQIDAAHGDIGIGALARQQSMSTRSLQTRFLRQVGLTAKEYARVQRLQATLRELDRDRDALSELALEVGFADQAHATREVRRFTGLTPAHLRRALRAEREGDATLRMAAAFVRGHARGRGGESVD